MKIFHKYDIYGRTEPSIIYLAKPGKRLFCALGGIDTSTVSLSLKTNNTAELTFTVDKYINNTITDGYEELDELMELYCDGIWFKIVDPPSINNDGMRETKEVTAESYEIMLTQYKLKNFKINMGEEDSYEMMYQATHDTSKFYQIKFYDPENEDLSFLHLVLKHADVPGWKIGYIDNITPDDDGKLLPDNICNFEVDDQNVYAFLTQEVAQAYKCVFEFDTINMTINAYRPDSLGKDTNVVLGFRNIQNSVSISRDENLVTQFYVDGLDDYNIDAVNFGDSVITDLTYFCCEPYMNATLQEKYTAWQNYRESRRDEYIDLSREYNKNLEILTELTNRVPVDTAQTNWFGKKVDDLKDAYDSNMAIIKGLESIYVDDEKNFDLDALKNSSDWSLYESIMNYTLPSIVAALQAQDETVDGFGKGNIISCVNPVVLGQDWYMIGSGTSSFKTVQIDDAPAYGITRGVQVTGTDGGIYQHNISIEQSQRYTLSCFVKGSGTFYLGYNNTGEDRTNVSYGITSSWTRVYTSFNLSSRLIDVAFSGTSDFTICGMQLEMGDSPSQFGYFTQSENIMKAYETDWKLYGISELQTKIATYDACIKELKKNGYADGYNPLSGYEEAYFTQMHQKYLDYLNLKEQAEAALAERQTEYDAAKKPEIQEQRNQIAKDVLMENFGKVQDKYPAFTEDETYIIKSLYNQSTYTNENIIVTSLDTTADAVDKSKVLYDDAIEELYVESHPQYTYTDDIENIYALPEFKEYHEQLAVNDFVRVGLTDTNYIKLRVVEITYNPCDLDSSMEITFSNVIQYKAKRNDYNSLLNDALNSSDRNGGRVNSVNKSSTSDYVITSDAIKQIFSNPLFNSMLGGTTTGGTGSGGTITADMIVAELVKAKEGVFDKLTVDTAFMKYLDVKLVSADTITTRILEAEQANIEKLSAKIIESNEISADMANIKNLVSGKAGIGELQTINLTAQNVTIDQAVITDLIAKKIAVGDLMAQNALANQIVLISKDNKPTIAFQESTQQFYDSDGNIRVQIGMDGNGDFNFIVRNGDKAALFDENGITQTGIPDNTIINDMIDNATITKDKLGFQVIEPNEQGGIDITNIYDGKGNQWWGIEKTSITNDYTTQIKNVTDTLTGEIEQKVSNTQYLKDQEAIQTEFSEVKQDVSGITSTVSSMRTDLTEAQEKITANSSSIAQNADSISFMVTGTRESGFELTQDFISMVSDHISIKAGSIDIDGVITAMNTHTGSDKTKIDGGIIETSTVNAMLIATKILRSQNFKDTSVTDGVYAQEGLEINMETGAMKAKNFAIDDSGNAYFKGNGEFGGKIAASSGYIGGTNGFVIEAGKLYSGKDSFDSTNTGVYIGIDGISLGENFKVDKSGNITAKSGEFTGTIYADSGRIGGWTISGDSLTNIHNTAAINPNYLQYGNNFKVDSNGYLTATGATISGTINASSGSFGGSLDAADGTFTGTLSAATGSFSGSITAESGTIGGFTIGLDSLYSNLDGNNISISPSELQYGDNFVINSKTGKIAGFTITTEEDNTDHAYSDTLYTQVTDSSGNIYQSGIRGTSVTNNPSNAAFYVRKKKSSMSSWTDAEYPFVVKKNGNVYCENLTVATDLYVVGNKSSSGTTANYKVLKGGNNSIDLGYLYENSNGFYTNKACYISFGDYQMDFYIGGSNYAPLTIAGTDSKGYEICPNGTECETSLGSSIIPYSTLYVNKIVFGDDTSMTTAKGSTTSGGDAPSGLYENTIRVGSSSNGQGAGQGNKYKVYSKSQWSYTDNGKTVKLDELPITCYTIGAVPLTSVDSNRNVSGAISSTLHMSNGKGWDLVSTGSKEVTGIYCNSSNQVLIGDTSYQTILRGSSLTLKGVTDVTQNSNYSRHLIIDTNGNLGYTTKTSDSSLTFSDYTSSYYYKISDGSSTLRAPASLSFNTNNNYLYLKDGSGYTYGGVSLNTLNGGGGSTYSAGTGITISGNTISVTSGTYASSSHTHDSLQGSFTVTVGSSTLYPSGNGSQSCGSDGHRWKNIYYTDKLDHGSDEYLKNEIVSIKDVQSIHNFYMSLNPIRYKFKQCPGNTEIPKIHFGFGARETERHLKENNFKSEEYSMITRTVLDAPNFVGRNDEYSMDYTEFISLNTHMTQKAHRRIDSLEEQNNSLISENQSLKNEILMLQGQLSLINQRLQKLEEKAC